MYDAVRRPSKAVDPPASSAIGYNASMDDDPPDAPPANRDNSQGPPLISTPLLTAVLVFIVLPLLIVLLVAIGLLP